jgi:hypothetical protein
MRRAAAGAAAAVERKNADQYSQELCAIMNVPSTKLNKLDLFEKIFEILDQDVIRSIDDTLPEDDSRLWYNTCTKYCGEHSTKGVLDLLRDVFYTEGKPIVYIGTDMITHNIGLPRVLFFELLLHLIEQLSKKAKHDYNKAYFERFIITVNDSDSSGILSYGVSDIDYFRFVTNENVEKINICIRNIDTKFTGKAPRQGNYTLAHVISSYCTLILIENQHFSLSQSQQDSQQDSQPDLNPNSLMNVPSDWRVNIQLATQDEIRAYKTYKVSKEQRQKIEDIKRREAEELAKVKSEREEHERRMREKNPQKKDDRPECFYDGTCYQRGEAHWRDFQHKKQQGPIPRRDKGGRRSQSKRSKYNTVRYSFSSAKRRSKRHRTRHTRRRRTKHRRH